MCLGYNPKGQSLNYVQVNNRFNHKYISKTWQISAVDQNKFIWLI